MVGHRLIGPIFSTTRAFHVVVIRDAQEMYVLALITQKGGSGKSTLAVGIAVAAMGNGELGSTADLLSSSIRRHRGAAA